MANDFVDRSATALGKLVVIQGRRVALPVDGGLVHYPINLICRHTDGHGVERLVQDFAAEPAGHSEAFDFFVVELLDVRVAFQLLLGDWVAFGVVGVVRPRDVIGHYARC